MISHILKIIRVHNDVYQRVNKASKDGVSSVCVANTRPHEHWNDAVMDHVQCRHLVRFLAENEENCIQKIDKFREEKEMLCMV